MVFILAFFLQAVLALRSVHIDSSVLYNQLGCKRVDRTIRSNNLLARYEEQGLTFEDFCMVYAELRHGQVCPETGKGLGSLLSGLNYLTTPLQWISGQSAYIYIFTILCTVVFLNFLKKKVKMVL